MTTTRETAIEVDGLRCGYGDFEAVHGVSFTVGRGEVFALLGTNGAGKTTTMEVLEGFAPARDGTARVLGLDPYRGRRELRPRIGIMLQEGGFFADLTTAETVAAWAGLAADVGRPIVHGILERVGLAAKAGTRVRQLSGGQKRRLDLALAVLSRPEVLFLDEPTTGMDPEARHETWKIIQEVRDEGTTVLLTTHYLEEAERLADHLAIMHDGVIHVHGMLDDVVDGSGDRITFRLALGSTELRNRLAGGLPFLEGTAPTVTYTEGATGVTYTLPGSSGAARIQRAQHELLTWAQTHDLVLERLEVRRGTLEDVFMRVVGEAR